MNIYIKGATREFLGPHRKSDFFLLPVMVPLTAWVCFTNTAWQVYSVLLNTVLLMCTWVSSSGSGGVVLVKCGASLSNNNEWRHKVFRRLLLGIVPVDGKNGTTLTSAGCNGSLHVIKIKMHHGQTWLTWFVLTFLRHDMILSYFLSFVLLLINVGHIYTSN